MSAPEGSAARPANAAPTLPPGTVVGGRFEVVAPLTTDGLGAILSAKDQKTTLPVTLRILPPRLVQGEVGAKLRAEARVASALTHRSILATYGVGTLQDGSMFVATESIDGIRLSDLLERRRKQGGAMSLRGAYNVIAHVCKALSYAQDRACHGTLRPSVVWVGRSGRVKVGDFGLGRVLVEAHSAAVLGQSEQACLAPEVKGGNAADARSDIFGLGAILYQLLTGRTPAEGFVPPSQAHPDATPEIDRVLLRCLAAQPSGRYASPDDVRVALLPLVADAPEVSAQEDFGMDEVDVDVDLASVHPPADPALARARQRPAAPAVESRPEVGARVSLAEPFRPSLAEAPRPSMADAGQVDLGKVLARITENDAPRWMAQKDGLDHGPFSGRELVGLIAKGEILDSHLLINLDTGARTPVKEHPDFAEFAEQYNHKRATDEHKAKMVVAAHDEKRSARTKVVAASAILVVLVAAGGGFLYTRRAAERRAIEEREVGELMNIGRITASASGDLLPDQPRHGGGGHRSGSAGGSGGGGGGGASGSYEDAMNQAMDLGDVTQGRSESRLTGAQVAEVMNRNISRIYSACVPAEQARGGELGRVQIDIAIASDGHVLGASARQGSGAFQSCIGRAVSSVRFPSFGAPRMGARYSFSAN